MHKIFLYSKTINTILFFLLLNFFIVEKSFALALTCPNFEFTKDLQKGSISEDVRALQELLNLDKRTLVTQTGLGSKGNETALFGAATRESLKRFQALFIEYIEVADGKFNKKTRDVANKICRGPYFTNGSGQPFNINTNSDVISPIVGISGPTVAKINEPFRMYIGASEALQTPTLEGLIISNAIASDVRKTSSTSFSFLVTVNSDAEDQIALQFEADSLKDLAGNKNENATNEWIINLENDGTSTATNTKGGLDLSILDGILEDLPKAANTNCENVASVDVYDYTNPCYGKVPTTNSELAAESGSESGGGLEQILKMLEGLMKGLGGLGGGGAGGQADAGGTGVAPGACMCAGGQPTIMLNGLAGPSGRHLMTANPGIGKYVGKVITTPPGMCGFRLFGSAKACRAACPGTCSGGCCNPKNDSTNQPVIGIIPPAPAFMWQN